MSASESAVLQRSRRATAGKRMSNLVGEALHEDEAFWGHDTWAEEGSDNDSFHESDEDSDQRKDEFDSDFNDSESDEEYGGDEKTLEAAKERGRQADRELERAEKKQRRVTPASSASAAMNKRTASSLPDDGNRLGKKIKRGTGRRAVMGDGINTGIALNLPWMFSNRSQLVAAPAGATTTAAVAVAAAASSAATTATSTSPFATEVSVAGLDSSNQAKQQQLPQPQQQQVTPISPDQQTASPPDVSGQQEQHQIQQHQMQQPKQEEQQQQPIQRRSTRHTPSSSTTITQNATTTAGKRVLRRATKAATARLDKEIELKEERRQQQKAANTSSSAFKKNKRLYTQEELLLEAVHTTEPENERWLLGRKRILDSAEQETNNSHRNHQSNNIIQKYRSRRGCLSTIHFLDMDHVPSVLMQQQPKQNNDDGDLAVSNNAQPKQKPVCIITQKPARYLDPLTRKPYHDVQAFKELRRRHHAGEPLEQGLLSSFLNDNTKKSTEKKPADTSVNNNHTTKTRKTKSKASSSTIQTTTNTNLLPSATRSTAPSIPMDVESQSPPAYIPQNINSNDKRNGPVAAAVASTEAATTSAAVAPLRSLLPSTAVLPYPGSVTGFVGAQTTGPPNPYQSTSQQQHQMPLHVSSLPLNNNGMIPSSFVLTANNNSTSMSRMTSGQHPAPYQPPPLVGAGVIPNNNALPIPPSNRNPQFHHPNNMPVLKTTTIPRHSQIAQNNNYTIHANNNHLPAMMITGTAPTNSPGVVASFPATPPTSSLATEALNVSRPLQNSQSAPVSNNTAVAASNVVASVPAAFTTGGGGTAAVLPTTSTTSDTDNNTIASTDSKKKNDSKARKTGKRNDSKNSGNNDAYRKKRPSRSYKPTVKALESIASLYEQHSQP